ncbi:MAG TPA: hypothetical protein VGI39_13640 [Polyangiaceae bacterium]|jgi:hypothetical protein
MAAANVAPARRAHLVVAALAALVSIPGTYAVQRCIDVLFRSEPNPATVIWSARIAMFWRLGISVYVAGMVAALVMLGARANLARAIRGVEIALVVAVVALALQGLLLP